MIVRLFLLNSIRGGELKTMKTILAISIMTILATGVLAPALQDAYALKADNSAKLSPKSFGEKTKYKISSESNVQQKQGFEPIKKEPVKYFKKIVAETSAKELMKKIYRLG